jgi:hypothetical protein
MKRYPRGIGRRTAAPPHRRTAALKDSRLLPLEESGA